MDNRQTLRGRIGRGVLAGFVTLIASLSAEAQTTRPAGATPFDYDATKKPVAKVISTKVDKTYTAEQLVVSIPDGPDIPAILCLPTEGTKPYPTVVLLHGALDRKETMIRMLAGPLTRNGIACLAFDLPGHGGRAKADKEGVRPLLGRFLVEFAGARPGDGGIPAALLEPLDDDGMLKLFAALSQGVVESRQMLDYLETRPDIDPDRLAADGGSMGGTLAICFAAVDPRVKAVVTNIAGGWSGMAQRFSKSPELKTAWESFDPTSYAPRIAPRPVLMINGRKDPVVKAANASDLYDRLGEPREIRWFDVGHTVTREGVQAGTAFLCKAFELPDPK